MIKWLFSLCTYMDGCARLTRVSGEALATLGGTCISLQISKLALVRLCESLKAVHFVAVLRSHQ